MTALVAVDLDRTLIFSAAAAGRPTTELRCVEHLDGAELSYMSPTTVDRLAVLDVRATVVPVTTRTVAQYRRVVVPVWGVRRYAVAANGGEILVDGEPDPVWRSEVDASVAALTPVTEVRDRVRAEADDRWLRSARIADDLFCYAVIDPAVAPDDLVERWRSWAVPGGWNVSRQGRKVYLMPDPVSKWAAVAEVARRCGTPRSRVFAAGDGALDRPMLEGAHRAVRPRHGELEELSWHRPTLSVSRSAGVAASEEIVATLLDWAGTDDRDGDA
ncbi:HAD hydrolase family protein [Williamsia deligens]|uniref:HAD hydrolase family protein n=1 Tax=Williamsia deligens TaxID=321325 RepID=A0ABW3GC07_9NOCA|nr:HAD hydrolase family protein [Williamsia deligens]MCP2195182.1 Hydroxymethylpyrimidine pyrophosphatase [Williamsia deligens]